VAYERYMLIDSLTCIHIMRSAMAGRISVTCA